MADREKMILGFTGTREGITVGQFRSVAAFVDNYVPEFDEFHHGDCIGADASAARYALSQNIWVACHPPVVDKWRAWVPANEFSPELPYLHRNQAIVDEADVLLAVPEAKLETVRSGVWATVRYARKAGLPVYKIYPDGTIEREAKRGVYSCSRCGEVGVG